MSIPFRSSNVGARFSASAGQSRKRLLRRVAELSYR
jgi:hypothetical protein